MGVEGRGEESWMWCNLRYDDGIPMNQAILECASDVEVFECPDQALLEEL